MIWNDIEAYYVVIEEYMRNKWSMQYEYEEIWLIFYENVINM